MGVRLLVVLLLRRILLLAVWVVVGRRSASWLSSVATAIHHHLLLLLLLLQYSPVLPVEHLYGLLVRQEGRIGMELLQEDDSPGLRDVQAVHGLEVCRQAQKCGVRQHDGSFSTGYSPEPPKSAPQSLAFVPWCKTPLFSSSSPEMHALMRIPETFPEMSTILYLHRPRTFEPPVKRLVFASTLQKNGRKKCCRMANCNVGGLRVQIACCDCVVYDF